MNQVPSGQKEGAGATAVLRVGMFIRHPRPGFHSIETVFRTVRDALPAGVRAFWLVSPFASKGILPRLRSALAAAVAMRRHDLRVAHVLGDEHFLVLLLPFRRTVLTIHDCDALAAARGLRGILLRLLWLHLPVRIAAAITTVSERSRTQLLELTGCNPGKVRVIANPLPAIFRPTQVAPSNRKPRVLHVGTKPNKNLARLVEAMVGIDAELVVVGKLDEQSLRLLRTSGIAWEGLVDASEADMLKAYSECTLLAFVSTSEGFGMPIIEAQAVGRPVLTSALSPMREVSGGAALLVDPFDVAAIRAGLQRLIADARLRDELVEAGLRNALRFNAAAIAAQYGDLYRQVAGAPVADGAGRGGS